MTSNSIGFYCSTYVTTRCDMVTVECIQFKKSKGQTSKQTYKQTNKQTNKLENPLVKGTAAGVISEEFITKTLKTIIFSAPNTTDPKLLIIASNYIRSNS